MKTYKKALLFFVFMSLTIACSQDDDKQTNSIADCETNDYGVLTVNFSSSETKHGILITRAGSTQSRDKIVNAGKTQDTVHLKSGTYSLEISSLNEQNQALDSELFQNYSITKCDEKTINVEF